MANLNSVVKIINDTLKATAFNDQRYSAPAMFLITKSLPYQAAAGFEYIPSVVDNNGEATRVNPDDRNVIQVYHKVNSIANFYSKQQFGNENENIVRTAQMSMIVFGQRNKIKLSDHDLDFNILASFPNKLAKAQLAELKIQDCVISYGSADFNSLQLYSREYNTKSYYLKPNHLFFEVKYTIECRLNKACINTCTEC